MDVRIVSWQGDASFPACKKEGADTLMNLLFFIRHSDSLGY